MKIHATSFGMPRTEKTASHDCFAVQARDETVIAVLADGAGTSREAGEASRKVVESLMTNYSARPGTWPPQRALTEFTKLINRTLYHDSMARFGAPELVSTLSVAVIEGDKLYGLNVGDSRVYISRAGELSQLSEDHVETGNAYKHILNRAIGLAPDVEPHCFEMNLADGDMAMLCSDGVSNVLNEGLLKAKLARRCAARGIVSTAREKATYETLDDMSAVVLDIEETSRLKAVSELPLTIPSLLKKGDVIDGFTLLKSFQRSDRVWLASRGGQRFTLKFAPLEAAGNEAVLNQFVKETWNATRLEADFFPKAFVPENASTRCYAMEFIEAPSLKMLLRSRRLAVDETIALGRFLLGATQFLLRSNLVHGDIKPENILVLSGYDSVIFKLVDFGSTTEIFSTTTRAGTASYLAPERFHEAPISERTEIFSIGVTLFEALTRTFPYGEIERFQTPRFHAPKRPAILNPNLPPWLDALILRAISIDPRARYRNYSELLFDLEHPDKVAPFHQADESWVSRNSLPFYRWAFYLMGALAIYLAIKLLCAGVRLP